MARVPKFVTILALICVLIFETFSIPAYQEHDLQAAASGHEHGRVQIKVYRGPSEHDHPEDFAPWGYWVKQPADDDHP